MYILRYLPLSLLILGLLIAPAAVNAQEQSALSEDAQHLLDNYFHQLQNGNSSEILNLITGPLLQKRGRLLRSNAQYGAFLRQRYANANFSILPPAFMHNNKLSLRASIDFDGKDKLDLVFSFEKDTNHGTLKIYSETEVQ